MSKPPCLKSKYSKCCRKVRDGTIKEGDPEYEIILAKIKGYTAWQASAGVKVRTTTNTAAVRTLLSHLFRYVSPISVLSKEINTRTNVCLKVLESYLGAESPDTENRRFPNRGKRKIAKGGKYQNRRASQIEKFRNAGVGGKWNYRNQ